MKPFTFERATTPAAAASSFRSLALTRTLSISVVPDAMCMTIAYRPPEAT